MKPAVIVVVLSWVVPVGASLAWSLANDRWSHRQIAFRTARSLFQFVVLTREWNARHGGMCR